MRLNDHASLLKDEYLLLQNFYEDVDKRCLVIKGWNITLAAAIIAVVYSGFSAKIPGILFIFGALASLIFWYVEAYWRGLHFFLRIRIKQIEKAFKEDNYDSVVPLQLFTVWVESYHQYGEQTNNFLKKKATAIPHIFIFFLFLILFIAEFIYSRFF